MAEQGAAAAADAASATPQVDFAPDALRFAASPLTQVCFDRGSTSLVTLDGTRVRVLPVDQAAGRKPQYAIVQPAGVLTAAAVSHDAKYLALLYEGSTVELVDLDLPQSGGFSPSRRNGSPDILDVLWGGPGELVLATANGFEVFALRAAQRALALLSSVRVQRVAWVRTLPEYRMAVAMVPDASAGSNAVTAHPVQFRGGKGNVSRLQAFGITPDDRRRGIVVAEDVSMFVLYAEAYLAYVDQHASTLQLFPLRPRVRAAPHTIKLHSGGEFAVHAVDNVLVVHSTVSKVSMLYDVKSNTQYPLVTPRAIASPPPPPMAVDAAAGPHNDAPAVALPSIDDRLAGVSATARDLASRIKAQGQATRASIAAEMIGEAAQHSLALPEDRDEEAAMVRAELDMCLQELADVKLIDIVVSTEDGESDRVNWTGQDQPTTVAASASVAPAPVDDGLKPWEKPQPIKKIGLSASDIKPVDDGLKPWEKPQPIKRIGLSAAQVSAAGGIADVMAAQKTTGAAAGAKSPGLPRSASSLRLSTPHDGLYAEHWQFLAPDLLAMLDADAGDNAAPGRVLRVVLSLPALTDAFTDVVSLVDFLSRRRDPLPALLAVLRQMLLRRPPLHVVSTVFDMLNSSYSVALVECIYDKVRVELADAWFAGSKMKQMLHDAHRDVFAAEQPSPYYDEVIGRITSLRSSLIERGALFLPGDFPQPAVSIASPSFSVHRTTYPHDLLRDADAVLHEEPVAVVLDSAGVPVPGHAGREAELALFTDIDGNAVVQPVVLYTHVLRRLSDEPTQRVPVAYLRAVVIEFLRSLSYFVLRTPACLHSYLLELLAADRQYYQLHQFLQFNVIKDSSAVAAALLELERHYPPALQLAVDMMRRLREYDRMVTVLVERGQLMTALRIVRRHRTDVPPVVLLHAAHASGDRLLFFNVMRFFQRRNIAERGTPAFLPRDACDDLVRAYEHMFAATAAAARKPATAAAATPGDPTVAATEEIDLMDDVPAALAGARVASSPVAAAVPDAGDADDDEISLA